MLKVLNVEQGDAFIINPVSSCIFGDTPLLVDTGPSKAKVDSKIVAAGIDVLLTHSHADHIGGLSALIRTKKIKNVYVPYYLPEVGKIFSYLKRHTKTKIKPINWTQISRLKFRFVAEGDRLCKHAMILNPPRSPYSFTSLSTNSDISISQAIDLLSELGIELPREEIENYIPPIEVDGGIDGVPYSELARKFVHQFFISLSQSLAGATSKNVAYYVTRQLELTSNESSIVFKFQHESDDWLFTGDADENVFERLLEAGHDISAQYLKVPHHGSRENLTKRILEAINPSHAIISHKNGKFGKSKDPHPHHEVIDMLDRKRINCYYTNAVIKDGEEIKKATTGKILGGLIEFI